jgi:hypothetical protein
MSVLLRCNGVGLALFAKNRNPLRIGKPQTRSSIRDDRKQLLNTLAPHRRYDPELG